MNGQLPQNANETEDGYTQKMCFFFAMRVYDDTNNEQKVDITTTNYIPQYG